MSQDTTRWPYLELELPPQAPADIPGQLTQVALHAGAVGGWVDEDRLILYLPKNSGVDALDRLRADVQAEAATLGLVLRNCRPGSLEDQPWATAWKDYFKSQPVGERLLIRPDWERGDPAPAHWADRLPIWIRPGAGFGTGTHATTRLALELMERHLRPEQRVLDFGSGSGVLAIAAVALGAGSVGAVEHDPEANLNARVNFDLNDCSERVCLVEGSRPASAGGTYDLVVCNMLPQRGLPHMAELAGVLANPHGRLIYSGFLADQKSEVIAAFQRSDLLAMECHELDEWAVVIGIQQVDP